MTKVSVEYERYQSSQIMKKLALAAHQNNYRGQTSSATFLEISNKLRNLEISKDTHILDAGCGNGTFSLAIAEKFPCRLQGIDLSEKLIQEANDQAETAKMNTRCKFSVGDFTNLPPEWSEKFDGILCVGSLYWGQSISDTFATWSRIVRKGGWLLLFLNVLYNSLTHGEIQAIGATQFIPALSLQKVMALRGWSIAEWTDETDQYSDWLNKWCLAMDEMNTEIIKEMGEVYAAQLISRFKTYYSLAQRKAVRRIILKAEYV